MTKPAERTIAEETSYRVAEVREMASVVHPLTDIGLERFLKDWEKAQSVKAR